METAPKDASWVQVKLPDLTIIEAHWASNLSGEEQPPFQGWFKRDGSSGYIGVPTPILWRPVQ
jgi:hypothetical protein